MKIRSNNSLDTWNNCAMLYSTSEETSKDVTSQRLVETQSNVRAQRTRGGDVLRAQEKKPSVIRDDRRLAKYPKMGIVQVAFFVKNFRPATSRKDSRAKRKETYER